MRGAVTPGSLLFVFQLGVKGPMKFFKSAVLALGMLLFAQGATFAQPRRRLASYEA